MKRLLIVVDYQNDFVDGSLGFEGAETLDTRIAEKIAQYHENGDYVFYTMDSHSSNYLSTQEGHYLPVVHCVEGTPGWELYGKTGTAIIDRDKMFRKPTFGSAKLFEYLNGAQASAVQAGLDRPYTSIELVGLVSNICVLSNAVIAKAACPDVPVIVDASCTASSDKKLHEAALDVLEGLQVRVVNRSCSEPADPEPAE